MSESQLETSEQIHTIWELGGLKPLALMKRTWGEMQHDDIFDRASALAYNFFMALFPALLFLLALIGMFPASQLRQQLVTSLANILPPAASTLLWKTMTEITKASGGGKLTFGIVLTLWSAASGVTSMISGLNAAYDLRDSRSYLRIKLISLALTVAISALVLAALAIVLFGGEIANWSGTHLGLSSVFVIGWRIVQWPAALFFVSVAFALLYYYGPNVNEQHWYWITPGSILGVLFWLLSSIAFRVYLHFFNTYSKSYGSLGAVIILMLWFYVTGLSFLVGGEINAEIEHAAAERGHPEAKEPGQKAA